MTERQLPCSVCAGRQPGAWVFNHPSCEAAILRAQVARLGEKLEAVREWRNQPVEKRFFGDLNVILKRERETL